MKYLLGCLACLLGLHGGAGAAEPHAFGVLNQHSLQMTAAYWNPILAYVSARSGVPLELHIGRTAKETTDNAVAGKLDFVYTNHLFTPRRAQLGWRVLARRDTPGIRGQIVVPEDSPVRTLAALTGRTVAFPNPYAFVGYYLPMERLLAAGIRVTPLFTGNQEAAMAQLTAGRADAAGVNQHVMQSYARRTGMKVRVLWESEAYFDLAIMAAPGIDAGDAEKVRQAFAGMARDPEGQKILQRAAGAVGAKREPGFVAADDADYANYRRFFERTQVPLSE